MNSKMKAGLPKKIHVLVIFANPRNTSHLRLGTEDRIINEAIQLSPHRDNISLSIRHAATIHDLRRSLLEKEFQIVHISGHGDQNGLLLEDEHGREQLVPQPALADLFQAYPIQCVLLNSCYSISQGELVSLGIPFTIAMEGPIDDQAALEFSRGFYDAIGAGRTIDFAYEEGCRSVKLTVTHPQFLPQIFVKDPTIKHFHIEGVDKTPPGYMCIKIDKQQYIAMNPSFYQSLQDLLDDLYLCYLRKSYSPYDYGRSWYLSSRSRYAPRLVIAPWSVLLPPNRNKPTHKIEPTWGYFSPAWYGLVRGTFWEILRPPLRILFGVATNDISLGKALLSLGNLNGKAYKIALGLMRWHSYVNDGDEKNLKLVSSESVNFSDYRFLSLLTSNDSECLEPHSKSLQLDGQALID